MWMGAGARRTAAIQLVGNRRPLHPLFSASSVVGPIMESPIALAIPLSFPIRGDGISAEMLSLKLGYREDN